MLAHINIGSNIGDSRSAIERAVAAVFALSQGITRRSSLVESEPWGFESPHRFLNIGVEIETPLFPEELLMELQSIEKGICADSHRNLDGSYRDRIIDIDLIFMARRDDTPEGWETVVNDSPLLTLPHPRASERPFVVAPIKELHPSLQYPESLLSGR